MLTEFLPRLANAIAQLLTVPPYAVAAVFLCMHSYVSDRLQSRGPFVAYVSTVAAIGYVYVFSIPPFAITRGLNDTCIAL